MTITLTLKSIPLKPAFSPTFDGVADLQKAFARVITGNSNTAQSDVTFLRNCISVCAVELTGWEFTK